MSAPSQPQNFYVQQANLKVFLLWDIVAGATSYNILRSTDGVTFASIGTSVVNNYLDITVLVGVLYYYQVGAVNVSGTGPYTSASWAIPTQTGDISLAEMRLRGQQAADRVGSNFVTLPEWNWNITQSYFEFYDLLETSFEEYFVAVPLTFTTDGSTYLYDLPDGTNYNGAPAFFKLLGVDCGLNTVINSYITLNRFNFIDRNRFIFPNLGSTFLGVFSLKYKVLGNKLMFIPTPAANQIIRIWYAPKLTQLLKDTDIAYGISGWLEYVIVDSAIKALSKEESDTTSLEGRKMGLMERIQSTADNRDIGEPATISDTRSNNRWGTGDGPTGGAYGGW